MKVIHQEENSIFKSLKFYFHFLIINLVIIYYVFNYMLDF